MDDGWMGYVIQTHHHHAELQGVEITYERNLKRNRVEFRAPDLGIGWYVTQEIAESQEYGQLVERRLEVCREELDYGN